MLSLFGPRLPIDPDELEFQFATFKWLIGQFGEVSETPLVLPTPEFFSPAKAEGHAGVRSLFDEVRRAAGLEDWPCELKVGATDRPIEAGNAHLLRHEGPAAPCGTFRVGEGLAGRYGIITYNPAKAKDRAGLVATFAHELGHYLMATAASDPPGGWELHELHTDLAGVYLGFGIFLANGAHNFSQFQSAGEMGWSSSVQGYLSEGALVTALVIFQRLAGRDPMEAAPFLKDYLRIDLRKADLALAKRHADLAAAVEAVDLAEYGSA